MIIREALISMGYREVKPGIWLKPVGYVCFSYVEAKNEWANSFRSGHGKVERWESQSFTSDEPKHGDYLAQLKGFECSTKTDVCIDGGSHFELSAIDL